MKFTCKLTLAFLLVSQIAIGLAAVFVWATTATEFNRYGFEQRQAQFIPIVTDYYHTQGEWPGVDVTPREQGLLPPFPQPGIRPLEPQPFALVNQNHVVIIPPDVPPTPPTPDITKFSAFVTTD